MSRVALVTGASAGIGREFARELSERDYEVVLVARRRERLDELAQELPSEAHVVACDLGNEATALAGKVDELGLEVDLLVNNAGFGTAGRFLELDPATHRELVRLNCETIVTLTHAFLPGMVERRRGGIINIASTAGFQPLPYEAVYSASKAFARTFSDALRQELRGTGVRVLAVHPGPVPTEFHEVSGHKPPGNVPRVPARQVARESLDAFERDRRSIVPGRGMRWYMRVTTPFPTAVKLPVAERMFRRNF
jgi:short-subunit dehydrogenase